MLLTIDDTIVSHMLQELPASAMRAYWFIKTRPLDSLNVHTKAGLIHPETLRRAVRLLKQSDWIYETTVDGNRILVTWMPEHVEEEVVRKLTEIREEVAFLGEWLLKRMLDILVHDNDYGDNARPFWLVAMDGTGRMELDRWYRSANVGFEFQGPQHFLVEEQKTRDAIKAEICAAEGMRLITLTAKDLDFDTLRTLIGSSLPLRPVLKQRPIARYLTRLARSYINLTLRNEQSATSV